MSKVEEKVQTTLSDEIIALAKKLESGIAIDKATGVGEEKKELYKENLPDDLTMDLVKKVSKYNSNFIAAGNYAFGTMAVDAMASNKKLDKASIEMKVGTRDSVTHIVDRSRSYVHRLGNGETTTKFGVVSSNYEVRAGKNSGQLKAARAAVAEIAFAKLSGK